MAKQICRVNQFALLLIACTLCAITAPAFGDGTGPEPAVPAMPFIFIENQGKYPDFVKYFSSTTDHIFMFSDDGTVITGVLDENEDGELAFGAVNVSLEGKNVESKVTGIERSEGVVNYLLGNDTQSWDTNIPSFKKLLYSDLYDGINLSISGTEGLIKREYIVSPSADPTRIRMHYTGASDISLGSDGMLIVNTSFGPVYEQAPRSYQMVEGMEQDVNSAFIILDNETVGFDIGSYDVTKELVIDPYIAYSSYLGGSLEDQGFDVAADDNGNAFITGYCASCNFPNTTSPKINPLAPPYYDGTFCHGSTDAFVSRISYNGSNATLAFSTFLGGAKSDFGRGIDIDASGNMYVCGNTYSTDFPVLNPWARGGSLASQDDVFVTKIRYDGQYIWYSSYIGGKGSDQANAIAVHSDNSVYITGETDGNFQFEKPEERYPVTAGAYQEAPNPDAIMGDAFATKMNPTGNMITYSTYISGNSNDVGKGIAVDDFGYAYIAGSTTSNNLLPAGVPGYLKTLQGGGDAFIFKMNFGGGSPVSYASYLGGKTGWDYGSAIAVDAEGCAYVTGATASTDFPIKNPQQSTKGYPYDYFDKDAFVTKFNIGGDNLEYSTYLGGSSEDYGLSIAVDDEDRPYVTGYTKSSGFPRYLSLKNTNNGNQDVFVTCYQADMRYFEYSTTFGGYYDDVGAGIAVDSNYAAYVTGYTKSCSQYQVLQATAEEYQEEAIRDTFPVLNWINYGSYAGNNLTGNYDAFITKLGHTSLSPDFTGTPLQGNRILHVDFTDTSTANANIMMRIWDFGDGNSTSCANPLVPCNTDHNYYTPGIYDVSLTLMASDGSVIKTKEDYIRVCNGTLGVNFTVSGFPQSLSPVNISYGHSYNFIPAITNGPATNFQWNFGDGTGNSTATTPSHSYAAPGAYDVALTASSVCGVSSGLERTNYVHVYGPPVVAFNNTTTFTKGCAPLTVQFNYDNSLAWSQYYEPTSFYWSFGDGYTSTQRNPSHQYNSAGNFTVTLIGTNPAGSVTKTTANYVSVTKDPVAIFSRSPASGPAPLAVQFTDASTGNPASWSWNFGDSGTSTLRNPIHTYTTPGTYPVTLTLGAYCAPVSYTWTGCVEVRGGFSPDFLLKRASATTWGNQPVSGTSPLNITFGSNMSVIQGLVDTYWWDYEGDGTWDKTGTRGAAVNNNFINTSHVYTALGNYTPILRVQNTTWGLDYNTGIRFKDYVGVYSPLIVRFTASPTTAVVGQTVSFTDTSLGNPVLWAWKYGDSTANGTVKNPTHIYTTPGTYQVNLTVRNAWGASNSTSSNPNITVVAAGTVGKVYLVSNPQPTTITVVSGSSSWRSVPVYLNKTDIGIDNYKSSLVLNRTDYGSFRNAAVGPSWITADKFSFAVSPAPPGPYNAVSIAGYSVNGGLPPGSGPVPLGNVTISGLTNGTERVSFNMGTAATYCQKAGVPLTLTSSPVSVRVYNLNPLSGYTNQPKDLDHNGLVDDFDGNGVANSQDVIVFFNAQTKGEVQATPPPYDYDGNGVVNLNDLIVFYTNYNAKFPFS